MELWKVMLIYVLGLVLLLYFLTILPGKRKNKKTREMHDSVAVGDTISTIGGIIGRVVERDEDSVLLCIDENNGTTMRIVIFAVQSVVEKSSTQN